MYNIVILGCENSHANSFVKFVSEGLYPEINVLGVYSDERAAAEKLHDEYGVAIMEDFYDPTLPLDGVMITARHGDNHHKYAAPYLERGIPMFIDKPITCTEEDAVSFMRAARDNNVRFCGGSTCAALAETLEIAEAVKSGALGDNRGGCIVAPMDRNSKYGGFTFYTQHLVEIMTTIFGIDAVEVFADDRDNAVNIIVRYSDFSVHASFVEAGAYYYSMSAYGKDKSISREGTFTKDTFRHEMNDMLDLLRGEPMKKSYENFIAPVFIMNAIMRAMKSGQWEKINKIEI